MNRYVSSTRKYTIGNAETVTVELETSSPYQDLTVWVHVSSGGTVNLSAQPLFGGANDGGATTFNAISVKKVKQITVDEVRPQTQGLHNHPDDNSSVSVLKSAVAITNSSADDAEVSVYLLATGGA
jgi:hypothetical protein